MKAYLLRNSAALPPFQKPASQLRLHNSTVGSRLRAQLAEIGCEVVDVNDLDPTSIAPGSLLAQDDLIVSLRLLRAFVSAIPDRRRSYRCEIDASRFTPSTQCVTGEPAFRALPLRYVGEDCEAADEPLRMIPATLHQTANELPVRIDQLTDMRIHIVDYYGIHVEHWFDLLTATSLYCREYIADRLHAFRFVPRRLVSRATSWSWFTQRSNSIGQRTRIHPTAVVEGCVVGDDVVIGPFAYLRSSVVGNRAVILERSTLAMALVGDGASVMGGGVVNSYLGSQTAIFAPALYNVVFGERGLLGGAGGFSDFRVGSGTIVANIAGKKVDSNQVFLGSAIGDDCFVGTNMIFAPGQTIPDGTKIFDNSLVKFLPTTPGGSYVVAGSDVIQVPDNFLGSARQ